MTDVDMLTAAVTANPDDQTAAGALYDALQEAGLSPRSARRTVNAIAMEALEARLVTQVDALVNGTAAVSSRLRSIIRRAAGAGHHLPPVTVVTGNSPPELTGEPPRNVFRGGRISRHSGWASNHWRRIEYRPSTLAVTVGAEWVAAAVPSPGTTRPVP
jgi:hypothetical protein